MSQTAFDPLLVDHLLQGDVQGAQQHLLSSAQSVTSPDRLIVDMLLPAMAEVGNRWERHQIEIYEEHLASQAIKSLLIRLPALPAAAAPPIGRTALVTCAPGDEHDLIPMAMSAYLETKGWKVKNLGGSLPVGQIVAAAAALEPDVLFITLTMLFLIDELLTVLDGLRRDYPSGKVIVGGRGTVAARALLESRGAFVARDFDHGHRLASTVPPRRSGFALRMVIHDRASTAARCSVWWPSCFWWASSCPFCSAWLELQMNRGLVITARRGRVDHGAGMAQRGCRIFDFGSLCRSGGRAAGGGVGRTGP